ncbi:MAG TPA: TetR/AcrR family transcriptional regulator [Conexibacter sp.]|nr:TetR/AcrR family transcriptional regulator [Conexibacter sp.]
MSKQEVRAPTGGRRPDGAHERRPPARRRRLRAAERRELIERAATEVFAEHGYAGASIDEIARRSGVTPPVVYDHFASKLDLFTRLLERTRDELLAMWVEQLAGVGEQPTDVRMRRAFAAWARYVEANRFASRMYFQEATGDPDARAAHRAIQAQGRAALGAIVGQEPAAEQIAGGTDPEALEMAAEVIRAGLAGLAIWWDEHPHVARERIVETAMSVLWVGFERLQDEAAQSTPG